MDTIFPVHPQENKVTASRSLRFICMINMLERMGYYGVRSIQTMMMINVLGMASDAAVSLYSLRLMLEYIIQAGSALISDRMRAWKGMAHIGLWMEMAGSFFIVICAALPVTAPTDLARHLFLTGLALSTAGTGLFKPNIVALTGLTAPDQKQVLKRFNWLYAVVNTGAMLGTMIVTISRMATNQDDFLLASLLSFAFTTASAIFYYARKNKSLPVIHEDVPLQDEQRAPYIPVVQNSRNELLPAGIMLAVTGLVLYLPTGLISTKIPVLPALLVLFPAIHLSVARIKEKEKQKVLMLSLLALISLTYWFMYDYSYEFIPFELQPSFIQGSAVLSTVILSLIAAAVYAGVPAEKSKTSLFLLPCISFLLLAAVYYIMSTVLPFTRDNGNHEFFITTMLIGSLAEILLSPVLMAIAYRIRTEGQPATSMIYLTLAGGCAAMLVSTAPQISRPEDMPRHMALICCSIAAGLAVLPLLAGRWLRKFM